MATKYGLSSEATAELLFFAKAKTNRKRFDTEGAPERSKGYPTAGAIFCFKKRKKWRQSMD